MYAVIAVFSPLSVCVCVCACVCVCVRVYTYIYIFFLLNQPDEAISQVY